MRIVFKRGALKSSLRQGQWVLGVAAGMMLGYCGYVQADTWIFQNNESRQLEELLHNRRATNGGVPLGSLSTLAKALPADVSGLIGRIEIPRLGVSVMVIEGDSHATLRRAVGHIPGTAMPGESGNIGISGHRDTFFRPLRNITRNDIITVTTLLGDYRYRVVSTSIVSPSDIAVLDPSDTEVLTLVTCYPFYYVGSAPNRFIVRAERVI